MIIIINQNKENKKFLPMLSLIKSIEETKKAVKKQLIDEIINEPKNLKAYKSIEVYEIGEFDETKGTIKTKETKKLFTYEELLNEIIEDLTERSKKEK